MRLLLAFIYYRLFQRTWVLLGSPLKLINTQKPGIDDEDYVVIKNHLSGICGSDLQQINVDVSFSSSVLARVGSRVGSDAVLGHEVVGKIIEKGKNVSKFSIGDRVVIADDVNCHTLQRTLCEYCRGGTPILCSVQKHTDEDKGKGGGWSEFMTRHQSQLFQVPDAVSDEEAVLAEPLSTSVRAVLRSPVKNGDKVLVIGLGSLGLGIFVAMKWLNIELSEFTALGLTPIQAGRSTKLGATSVVIPPPQNIMNKISEILETRLLGKPGNQLLERGYDVVFDCVGKAKTTDIALRCIKARGTMVRVGFSMRIEPYDLSMVSIGELNIIGCHGYGIDAWNNQRMHTIDRVLGFMKDSPIDLAGFGPTTYRIDDYQSGIGAALNNKHEVAVKMAFDYRS